MRPRREAPPALVRIEQRRISRLGAHLLGVPRGGVVAPVVGDLGERGERLAAVGFAPPVAEGQVLLPAIVGRRTRFNADGDDRPERTRPKERVPSLTSVPSGGAPDQRRVHNWSYARYPRSRVPGPNVELRVAADARGRHLIATESFRRGDDDARLTHTINLLLEVFGDCLLLRAGPPPPRSPLTHLNWTVCAADPLDPGAVAARFGPAIDELAPPVRAVARHRLRRVLELGPDFVAVGRAGYRGCGVFGFGPYRRFVVESLFHDNATHVSGRSWDELSRRPKCDLLAGLPGDQPIAHARGWEARLRAAVEG